MSNPSSLKVALVQQDFLQDHDANNARLAEHIARAAVADAGLCGCLKLSISSRMKSFVSWTFIASSAPRD